MRSELVTITVGMMAVASLNGCATKGYVNTAVADGTAPVERRVTAVERGLEDTVAGTGQNAGRIRELDGATERALESAIAAGDTAERAETSAIEAGRAADDADQRARALELAQKRLLLEVILSEDHGDFAFAQSTLPDGVTARLDELVAQAQSLPAAAHLEIEGHTDATGPPDFNQALALRRAEAVRRYLHEHHRVPLHKMNVISYGEERPVAPNDSREGRARNRRVVVRVLG